MREIITNAEEISKITHATAYEIRRYAKRFKYCFYVPVIERGGSKMPRCCRNMGYVAIYTKGGHFAFVFTNSSYLANKKYADVVKIVE